jgi:serine/threonine protein phosphatase PrpC
MQITASSHIGLRSRQEDRYLVHGMVDGVLLAVMDGHNGNSVADICQDYLPALWDVTALTSTAGKRSFDKVLGLVVAQLDAMTREYSSGSTIALAFVPHDGSRVYLATLGDSLVVVRDPLNMCHTSVTHNVRSNLDERQAAIMRGGAYADGYMWNHPLACGLQMGRALGDGPMGPMISKIPDIGFYELGDFVLLATDGVFDPGHSSSAQAVAEVVAMIDAGAGAEAIVERAVKIPTGDNATCVLLKKEKVNEGPEQSNADRQPGPRS